MTTGSTKNNQNIYLKISAEKFLLSHVYDDLLFTAATTVVTIGVQSSVRKRQQSLMKRH